MQIRQATSQDTEQVLEALSVLNVHGVDFFTKKRVKDLIKKHCVGLITNGSDVVGACSLTIDDSAFDMFRAVEVFALGISPHYQGMGVGSKFLLWTEAMAKGLDIGIIYANSYTFYGALPFYEKNGYTCLNEVQDTELLANFYTFCKVV